MTVIATALKHLMAAGMTGDALIAAIEEIETAMKPKRSSGAERQAAYRERKKAEADVTSDVTRVTDVTERNGEKVSPRDSEISTPSQSPPISPPFPIAAAVQCWNDMAEANGLPKVLTVTGKRQTALKARIAEHGEEGFRAAVGAVARSKFCLGENDRGWRADIGFLLRPDNFAKLIEGGYGPPPPKQIRQKPLTARDLECMIAYAEDHDDPDRAAELRQQLRAMRPPADPNVARLVGQAAQSLRVATGGRA